MITKLIATLICVFIIFNVFSQTIIVLQPDGEKGKDVKINSIDSYTEPNGQEIQIATWTFQGNVGFYRTLIEFDLSSIPTCSCICNAKLYLYGSSTLISGGHSQLSGSNEIIVQRIVEPWEEQNVLWSNQPRATERNQVITEPSTSEYEDYIIDVSNLIQDMIADPDSSYGFILKLQTEQHYRNVNFASSDHVDEALHPKLEITYKECACFDTIQVVRTVYDTIFINETIFDTTFVDEKVIKFKPDGKEGKDVKINNIDSYTDPNAQEIQIATWTFQGRIGSYRSLIEFDLSSIPSGCSISSAELSLFGSSTLISGGHSQLSGTNEMIVQRIIEPWDEQTVLWSNQPKSTIQNQVITDPSTSEYENYKIDVLNLVQDMIANPDSSYGFLLKLLTEQYYRNLNFASSDHVDDSLHPQLEVTLRNCPYIDTIEVVETIYDTIFINKTLYDTTFVNVMMYDTISINEVIFDTIIVNKIVYDTTFVEELLLDTILVTETVYDTTFVNETILDTTIVEHNVYIVDTINIYNNITVDDTLIIDVTWVGTQGFTSPKIKIYPNPTKDMLVIDNGDFGRIGKNSLRITDTSGQLIFESKINQIRFQLNLSEFGGPGLYFVEILDESSSLICTRKIILA